ncbi:Gorasp2 [Symbiodinium sp. CCMP2592]|nr:Gorasp2 [Symbiodinium sp. CCMP2592]
MAHASQEHPDLLAERVVEAVLALEQPSTSSDQVREACELCDVFLQKQPSAELARKLVSAEAPPVQRLGFQLTLTWIRSKIAESKRPAGPEWTAVKAWLLELSGSNSWSLPSTPNYVRRKCAEVVSCIARLDWPGAWPELSAALLTSLKSQTLGVGPALVSLGVWSQLAESVVEDTKDMTAQRRREVAAGMTELFEAPSGAPALVEAIQATLQRFGGDSQVVREVLTLCRALPSAVPVKLLLRHHFDKIVQIGFQSAGCKELAVTVLASWAEQLGSQKPSGKGSKGKGESTSPATHDICRLTALIARLVEECKFEFERPQSYGYHQQVGRVLADLCSFNAAGFCEVLPPAEMGTLWAALLFLLRYPSAALHIDAMTSMVSLARHAPKASGSGPSRPPLETLVGALHVAALKADFAEASKAPGGSVSSERSAWLLRCLGPASSQRSPSTIAEWSDWMAVSASFDEVETTSSGEATKAHKVGMVRTLCRELLAELCRPGATTTSSDEGFDALCRFAGALVARALAGDSASSWTEEYDSALVLVEAAALEALKYAEKNSIDPGAISKPMLSFLQQVCVEAPSFNPSIEHRRLEFLSSCSPFFKHWSEEVLRDALTRILSPIRSPHPEAQKALQKGIKLEQRALSTFVAVCKSGVLRANQLEALNQECMQLAGSVSSAHARGQLIEALALALASCPDLDKSRQVQLFNGVLEQGTTAWLGSEIVSMDAEGFLGMILAAARESPPLADFRIEEPNLAKLRDARTLLSSFTGIVSRTAPNTKLLEPSLPDAVVKEWAPGIFRLLQTLANVYVEAAAGDELARLLVFFPAKPELEGVLGRYLSSDEEKEMLEKFSGGLNPRWILAIRGLVHELRCHAAKAARSCMACHGFWEIDASVLWLRDVAQSITAMRPHTAELYLRELFMPLVRTQGLMQDARLGDFSKAFLPALIKGISTRLQDAWAVNGVDVESAVVKMSTETAGFAWLDPAHAASAISFSRAAVHLLAALAGTELPQANQLEDPQVRVFQAKRSVPQSSGNRKKRKGQNANRFAALEQGDAMEAQAEQVVKPQTGRSAPTGLVASILRDSQLRDTLRGALEEFLLVPEKETMTRALAGLAAWTSQLWNMIARGEDLAALSTGSSAGDRLPETGEILHVASDVLRIIPRGILKPIGEVVAGRSPRLPSDGGALCNAVQQSWSSFTAASVADTKPSPSLLVSECTNPVFIGLLVLVKFFKLQCRKLELSADAAQLYLCPPLVEALRVLQELPNTSQDDAETLLDSLLKEGGAGVSRDMQRNLVRALLFEASPGPWGASLGLAVMGSTTSTEIGGVRVFKVSPGSPAAEAGLEVFFDFILAINGIRLEPGEQSVFAKNIQEAENGSAKLTVYNTRANMTREVAVMPRKWAGTGLLGATVRYDAVDVAENHGIRVLEVFPNSPAAHAGLVPFQDFLLGTPQRVFHDIDELVEVVQANLNERMQVYVYNADTESIRETILVPNNSWGGDGCIGCDIGTGLLHRIPAPRRPPGGPVAATHLPQTPVPQAPPAVANVPPAPICVPAPADSGIAPAPAGIAVPPPAVPTGAPLAASTVPAVASAVPGIPLPPAVAAGAPSLPAIRPGGAWAPPPAQVPGVPATSPPQNGLTPEAMAALQAQIQQMGLSNPAATGAEVLSPTSGAPENPKAPPSTPMSGLEMPASVDLSAALDPSKFAGLTGQMSPPADAAAAAMPRIS